MRKQNTYLVDMGTERIGLMLKDLVGEAAVEKARLLQNMIIGLMIANITEERSLDEAYINHQVSICIKALEI